MSNVNDIWQIIRQTLSDPMWQGVGTVISIVGSIIAVFSSKSSQRTVNLRTSNKKTCHIGRTTTDRLNRDKKMRYFPNLFKKTPDSVDTTLSKPCPIYNTSDYSNTSKKHHLAVSISIDSFCQIALAA
jgi:hypothetical protein